MKIQIHTSLLRISMAASLVLIFFGCSLDPEKKLDAAIQAFQEKNPGADNALASAFLGAITVDSLEGENIKTTGNVLYTAADNELTIAYPESLTLSSVDNAAIFLVDRSNEYAVISDGIQLCIFSANGKHLQDENVGDAKNPARAVLISDDDIIYYKNSNLYRYSIIHKAGELFHKDTFPPPYRSYYSVSLHKYRDFICICAGIAGAYGFSIIERTTGAIVLKNLSLSSSKYYLSGDVIHYISGNSGNWELMQYSINKKSKQSIARFSDIIDIDLTSRGYVCESKNGVWTAEYGRDKLRVPFPYRLAGAYKGRILLNYTGSYYFIDFNKMTAALQKLKREVPDLFSDNQTPIAR